MMITQWIEQLHNYSPQTKSMNFKELCDFFRKEAKDGHYHNPYDVEEFLCLKLVNENNACWENEDLAHDIGLLFWDM